MSGPSDLVAGEGVDEGSAAATVEGEGDGGGDGVLGEPPHGAPVDEAHAAEPVDTETAESREVKAERGPGQQVQTGEG